MATTVGNRSVAPTPLSWKDRAFNIFAAYSLYACNALTHRVRLLYQRFWPPEKGPDLLRSYSCRPWLHVRVFFPASYKSSTAPEKKLPTLLTIHGGGFVLGTPEDFDLWNHDFAQRTPVLVISLDYSKAPMSPFPCAIYDLEALVLAVLADKSLPIDTSRVAIGGWSAGGNLALSVASLPSMRGENSEAGARRIHAVVPMYPVADFSIAPAQHALSRPYKPLLKDFRSRDFDYLLSFSSVFDWAYVPSAKNGRPADLTNPLLSPVYLPRDELPPYIFTLACELDMLAMGGWRLASQLAGRAVPNPITDKVGQQEISPIGELIQDDERFAFEKRTASSSYRWLLVPNVVHGFDQPLEGIFKNRAVIEDATLKRDKCMELIGEWLFSGPFADKK